MIMFGCNKKYSAKACFNLKKDSFLVNENFEIKDCSKFLKGDKKLNASVLYDFGDGNSLWVKQGEVLTYKYVEVGEYVIKARIGFPDGPSNFVEKSIVIID